MLQYKQAIVVRTDLKMGKGKIAAQVAHASLSSLENVKERRWIDEWREEGQPKIVLKVRDEEELLNVYKEALKAGLPCSLIQDRGLTQLEPGTYTCVGIGPAPSEMVDKVTGRLKLL
jgi:PTH2 family peptidyl-tRNA hydrolase